MQYDKMIERYDFISEFVVVTFSHFRFLGMVDKYNKHACMSFFIFAPCFNLFYCFTYLIKSLLLILICLQPTNQSTVSIMLSFN